MLKKEGIYGLEGFSCPPPTLYKIFFDRVRAMSPGNVTNYWNNGSVETRHILKKRGDM